GATETTPLATFSRLKSYQLDLTDEERVLEKTRQGILVPGLEMKIIDDNGEVPWNDEAMGELLLRGPCIADSYYNDDRSEDAFIDGWYHARDVVTVDEEGTMKIVDRTGDLIKSSGEWIYSVEIENFIIAHEAVFDASVVARPNDKWNERP